MLYFVYKSTRNSKGLAEYIKVDEIHFTQLRIHIKKMSTNVSDIFIITINYIMINESITLLFNVQVLSSYQNEVGNQIEDKWKKKCRGFLKLHIAVDTKSKKIIAFKVNKGTIHDTTKKFVPTIKENSKHYNITKVYAYKT